MTSKKNRLIPQERTISAAGRREEAELLRRRLQRQLQPQKRLRDELERDRLLLRQHARVHNVTTQTRLYFRRELSERELHLLGKRLNIAPQRSPVPFSAKHCLAPHENHRIIFT